MATIKKAKTQRRNNFLKHLILGSQEPTPTPAPQPPTKKKKTAHVPPFKSRGFTPTWIEKGFREYGNDKKITTLLLTLVNPTDNDKGK